MFARAHALPSVALVIFATGCTTVRPASGTDPREALKQVCSVGEGATGVRGSVWMSVRSAEGTGRFPADVRVDSPEALDMEVTNLLGGVEGTLSIRGQKYQIEEGKVRKGESQKRKEVGEGQWRGLPLTWATTLFLGRVPCAAAERLAKAAVILEGEGDLDVRVPAGAGHFAEHYVYRTRLHAGSVWPETLHWERSEGTRLLASVDFTFEDPEDGTRSPRKWEARTSLGGEGQVKVRWRDREVLR